MYLEALGSALLGLVLAWAALHRLPDRLPGRGLVLGAGALGGVFGAFVTHGALGPGHSLAILVGAVAVAAVLLSLLVRPASRRLRRSATV
ncbi:MULTISPECIES: hypothetical protein [unclassified Streptomyces]|uniref:hypothetical protein n=1 Tax=unclassified Streptomyces TaxID=2593676 RepID=UPI0006AF7D0B|nr:MULTISPECIES: hypothetical protein [unclassified Streptomyces]KOX34936.1 integral membrane protein [Streptomyces sp. NRRL F-6491]KOX50855.1 integral membrane protein [Streptomyces sp. NRRL F-6492]